MAAWFSERIRKTRLRAEIDDLKTNRVSTDGGKVLVVSEMFLVKPQRATADIRENATELKGQLRMLLLSSNCL